MEEFDFERIKQPLLIGAIAGASTVMLYQVIFNRTVEQFSFGKVAIGVVVGVLVAAAAFGITFWMTREQ